MTETPYFSTAPSLPTSAVSLSLLLRVCVCTLSMCYACEGSVTACFPLSYHSCPTHTLHPVGLPANEGESRREREVRKELEKHEKEQEEEDWRKSELSIEVV